MSPLQDLTSRLPCSEPRPALRWLLVACIVATLAFVAQAAMMAIWCASPAGSCSPALISHLSASMLFLVATPITSAFITGMSGLASCFLWSLSQIPHREFDLIAAKLCDGTHAVLNKDSIRAVLRSLNMQLYIEKWLQIIHRVTGIMPPMPGPLLVQQLDELFLQLQRPFEHFKTPARKKLFELQLRAVSSVSEAQVPTVLHVLPPDQIAAEVKST